MLIGAGNTDERRIDMDGSISLSYRLDGSCSCLEFRQGIRLLLSPPDRSVKIAVQNRFDSQAFLQMMPQDCFAFADVQLGRISLI
jgi:hypothetical protein